MHDDRTLFTFPIVDRNEPLVNDPFYAWLDANVDRREPDRFLDHLKAYRGPMGYDIKLHIIGEQAYQTLEYVIETWLRLTPFFGPQRPEDLFQGPGVVYTVVGLPGQLLLRDHRRSALRQVPADPRVAVHLPGGGLPMRRYRISFTGRLLGAIGVRYTIEVEVEAPDPDAAVLKLYDTYDSVWLPVITELEGEKQ